jgi:hypothetical protein
MKHINTMCEENVELVLLSLAVHVLIISFNCFYNSFHLKSLSNCSFIKLTKCMYGIKNITVFYYCEMLHIMNITAVVCYILASFNLVCELPDEE